MWGLIIVFLKEVLESLFVEVILKWIKKGWNVIKKVRKKKKNQEDYEEDVE